VPVHAEIPEIDAVLRDGSDGKSNPLGVKAVRSGGGLTPHLLKMSDGAAAGWQGFADHVEGQLAEGGELYPIKAFGYTPNHSSRLNQIEIWLSGLTRTLLRCGSFTPPDDLDARALAFSAQYNRTAGPFEWTYKGTPLTASPTTDFGHGVLASPDLQRVRQAPARCRRTML
jgi:hypothetical protein